MASMQLQSSWLYVEDQRSDCLSESKYVDISCSEETAPEELQTSGVAVKWPDKIRLWQGEEQRALYKQISELRAKVTGTLYISNAFLYYLHCKVLVKVPLWNIHKCVVTTSIETLPTRVQEDPDTESGRTMASEYDAYSFLEVQCKDFGIFQFAFYRSDSAVHCQQILKNLCFGPPTSSFAFTNREYPPTEHLNGWQLFSWEEEFKRLKLDKNEWQLTSDNENYELCKSYPSKFIVPAAVNSDELKQISLFRSSGRMTALSWRHQNGATITRCSQPLVGLLWSRSEPDEKMLRIVRELNPSGEALRIVDCRSRISAYANKAKMGGTESLTYYEKCTIEFLGIENIHVMRDSMHGVASLVSSSSGGDITWNQHTSRVLKSAIKVSKHLLSGISVLIHCSDGWDRTAQISSLSQILLDPYFRTMVGFEKLIEKEWISFGHKFGDRVGHGKASFWNDHECSPIFLQFLDSVYQLLDQFPKHFEFSPEFLCAIMDNVYGCSFGTFLFNNEYERKENEVMTKTCSLWNYLNDKNIIESRGFLNEFYNPDNKTLNLSECHVGNIKLWKYYFRRNGAATNEDPEAYKNKCISQLKQEKTMLESALEAAVEKLSYFANELSMKQEGSHLTVHVDGSKHLVVAVASEKGCIPIIENYDPNRSEEQMKAILSNSGVDTHADQFDVGSWSEYFTSLATSIYDMIPYSVNGSVDGSQDTSRDE